MSGVDVLICAEDPGACNYLAPLPAQLSAEGLTSAVIAHPRVAERVETWGAPVETPPLHADAAAVWARRAPRALVTGTTEFRDCLGLKLIDAARRTQAPSVAVIDMMANAEHRFRGASDDPLRHAPDWLAVSDAETLEAFAALGFPRQRIALCGHPHFDVVRARRAGLERRDRGALRRELFPGANGRKVVVFVAESVDQLDPGFSRRSATYTLRGRGGSDYRTAIVLEEFLDAAAKLPEKPYVVLRLHPKNDPAEFSAYERELDFVSAGGDPLPLVWAADAVVGMTSMLLIEAHLLGRAALSILPRSEERELIVTTANGITPVASSRDEICALLPTVLDAREPARGSSQLPDAALDKLVALIANVAGVSAGGAQELAVELRPFETTMICDEYVSWLNDRALMLFSRNSRTSHSVKSCHEYAASFDGVGRRLFGIFERGAATLLGTLTISLSEDGSEGEIGVLVGRRGGRRRGVGQAAWNLAVEHAFADLGVARLSAGADHRNLAMLKIMERSGMEFSGTAPGDLPDDPDAAVRRYRLERNRWMARRASVADTMSLKRGGELE